LGTFLLAPIVCFSGATTGLGVAAFSVGTEVDAEVAVVVVEERSAASA